MTLTIEEARKRLEEICQKAEAGEEVLLGRTATDPTLKLVPLVAGRSRLTPHPDLIGSMIILDPKALVTPLPAEEWGELGQA